MNARQKGPRRRVEDSSMKWVIIALAMALLATAVFDLATATDYSQIISSISIAVFGLVLLTYPRLLRQSFRAGYFHSRQAFWQSHEEARLRGMDMEEWLEGERDRDRAMIITMFVDP